MVSEEKKQIILIVDDKPANLDVLRAFLKENNLKILVANSGETALKRIANIRPDMVLLDVMMPGIDGFETCRQIKKMKRLQDVPIIFMTALTEPKHKAMGFSAGAVDYLTKPIQKEELLARVAAHLEIKRYRNHLEEEVLKKTEELRKSEEEYRLLFNNANDAILIFKEGLCTNCNLKALDLFNCSREKIIGKSVMTFFTPEKQPDGIESKEKLIEIIKNNIEIFEMQLLRDNEKPFDAEIHLNQLQIGKERLRQAIIHDISQRKNLQKMKSALIHSSKMAEIGALTTGIVHEIKNPLAGIEQTIQNIKKRLLDDSHEKNIITAEESGLTLSSLKKYLSKRKIDHMIDNISFSCSRVDEIIKNMLPYSRKTIRNSEKVDISAILKETLFLARFNSEFINITDINTECEKNLPAIYCSKNEIQQVLLNILTNGAQSMMEYKNENISYTPSFRIELSNDKINLLIRITDNGPGINEDIKSKIFDPFFTTKSAEIGTGLGLFICKQIVEVNHHGTISIEDISPHGTSFLVKLPLKKPVSNP
jgi:PAS domain S-box-containing protein